MFLTPPPHLTQAILPSSAIDAITTNFYSVWRPPYQFHNGVVKNWGITTLTPQGTAPSTKGKSPLIMGDLVSESIPQPRSFFGNFPGLDSESVPFLYRNPIFCKGAHRCPNHVNSRLQRPFRCSI